MKQKPHPPTVDMILAMIGVANSAAALAGLLRTVTTYFSVNQRDALEAALMDRQREFPAGKELRR
jgi:hypothetical protein